ncbi:c-type cytochrome [Alcaligenaceae bacterium]|nr:c-type cytochrome [Alcaligenaceae bacterium]
MVFRRYAGVFVVSSIVAVAAPAAAQSGSTGQQLASSNNCLACHQIDSKRVGPAFNVIAQRFVNQDGAADYLAATIRSGGRGRWGAVPMPAQPQVSPDEAQQLAAWILSLAADASSAD